MALPPLLILILIHTVKRSTDMNSVTITVGPIDVTLLRQQRDYLLNNFWNVSIMPEEISGVINLLDSMLDQAEDEEV